METGSVFNMNDLYHTTISTYLHHLSKDKSTKTSCLGCSWLETLIEVVPERESQGVMAQAEGNLITTLQYTTTGGFGGNGMGEVVLTYHRRRMVGKYNSVVTNLFFSGTISIAFNELLSIQDK